MTRPFHLSCFQRFSLLSLPYVCTRLCWVATAEYTSAKPTKWALLTGRPCARIGAAKWAGSRLVMVAAGATPLMVMPSLMMLDRSALISPTS